MRYKNFRTLSKIKLSHNWRMWQSRSSFQFVLVLHEYLLRLNIRILYVRLYCIWCHLYLCLTFHWTTILQFLPNKYIRSLNIWSIQQSCTETYSTITCIGEFTDHPNAGICVVISLLTFCSFCFQYFFANSEPTHGISFCSWLFTHKMSSSCTGHVTHRV